jgi:hypothetical protein
MLGQGSYMICIYNPHWDIMWERSMRRYAKGLAGKELELGTFKSGFAKVYHRL